MKKKKERIQYSPEKAKPLFQEEEFTVYNKKSKVIKGETAARQAVRNLNKKNKIIEEGKKLLENLDIYNI